jgi:glycosyltransferase involved in cell wall biosynthesis
MGVNTLPEEPSVSIVTVVYNNADTIADAIESVLSQTYDDVEYLVIDGASTDGTREIIAQYEDDIDYFESEPDDGIYSAMNKGIRASGGDVVGILNADDFYADDRVLERVVETFSRRETDCVYGDLVYVEAENPDEIVRFWRAGDFQRKKFRRGWMPPHPTLFVRRDAYERHGLYREDLDISADYELAIRFLYCRELTAAYLPETLVRMRVGGSSNESLFQRVRGHFQDYCAWAANGKFPNPFTLTMKPLSKLKQFAVRPDDSSSRRSV